MIRRSPAEYYIKFLVSHPDGFTNENVREVLEDRGLDYLRDAYVDKLRAAMMPPVPFYPKDRRHQPSQKFLQQARIARLYFPDEPMKVAWEVLGRPRIKETIETLLIVGAPDSAIAMDLRRQYGVEATANVVEVYRHFFWNLALLDSTDVRVLLQMRDEAGLMEDDLAPRFEANIRKKAGYQDPRRIAASLPSSPISAIITRMKMGHMPSRLDHVKILQSAATLSSMRAWEAAALGGMMSSKQAVEYSTTAKNLQDLLSSMAMPTQDLRRQLGQVVLRGTGRAIPTIDMVSEGNHTAELMSANQEDADDAIDDAEEDDEDLGDDPVGAGEGEVEGGDESD